LVFTFFNTSVEICGLLVDQRVRLSEGTSAKVITNYCYMHIIWHIARCININSIRL